MTLKILATDLWVVTKIVASKLTKHIKKISVSVMAERKDLMSISQ